MLGEYTTWKPAPPKCGSCGRQTEELTKWVWDARLMVCQDCEKYFEYRCPDCGSDALEFTQHDYGIEQETGYRDAGERALCHDCGHECDERDTRVKIGTRI